MCIDVLIFALTAARTWNAGEADDLALVVRRDGAAYFAAMALVNLANILSFFVRPRPRRAWRCGALTRCGAGVPHAGEGRALDARVRRVGDDGVAPLPEHPRATRTGHLHLRAGRVRACRLVGCAPGQGRELVVPLRKHDQRRLGHRFGVCAYNDAELGAGGEWVKMSERHDWRDTRELEDWLAWERVYGRSKESLPRR
jgi:hypothetical protein